MGVLTKYDQIDPIYLPQSVVTYIYLHSVHAINTHRPETLKQKTARFSITSYVTCVNAKGERTNFRRYSNLKSHVEGTSPGVETAVKVWFLNGVL
jgi:nitrate reductase cytochrome c-type subunit